MGRATLVAIVYFALLYACYVDHAGSTASTEEGGGGNETYYCHEDLKLRRYVRDADNNIISTDTVATVDVKVVVSGDEASVMLSAITDKGKHRCVKYKGISIDSDYGTDALKGLADGGFELDMHEDAGFLGQPTTIKWAKANRKGLEYGADFLTVGVGKGLYKDSPGEGFHHNKTYSHCPSASQDDPGSGDPDCTEYGKTDAGWEEIGAQQ